MPALLLGHGQALPGEEVRVPPGMTLNFLIDEGRRMEFVNGVGVVMTPATLEEGGFRLAESHSAGETVNNHELSALSDFERSLFAQVDPENGTCFYAGESGPGGALADGVRLCSSPEPDGPCAADPDGVHHCAGLLSMQWPDSQLYWVSCRESVDDTGLHRDLQFTYGSELENPDLPESQFHVDLVAAEALLASDEPAFREFFDPLTDQQKALCLTSGQISTWFARRQARDWLAGGATPAEFYAFVRNLSMNDQEPYNSDAELAAIYAQGQRDYELENYIAPAREYLEREGQTNFLLWVNRLEPSHRRHLAADPDLAAAMAVPEGDPRSPEVQEARFGMTVDQIDWATVQGVSEASIKDADDGGEVPFWQLPSGEVAIGTDQPDVYRRLIETVRDGADGTARGNAPTGRIRVTKGGGLSHGRLDVYGATDPATMDSWIGAFSDKRVVHHAAG